MMQRFEIRTRDGASVVAVCARLDEAIRRARAAGRKAGHTVYVRETASHEVDRQSLQKGDKVARGAMGNARGTHTEVLVHRAVHAFRVTRVF